jgi:outer membrane lipoprotein
MYNKFLFLSLIIFLVGCATSPNFDTTKVDQSLTPQSVIAEPDISRNKMALWGGTILDTRNLKDTTQVEVLAYPLDSFHRPMQESKPLGRFIIQHQGYLEPANYAQGRRLTVLGSVSDSKLGKVGESNYTYPVINRRQLHLWSERSGESKTIFHLGIGVRL